MNVIKYNIEDTTHTISLVAGQITAICIENKTAVIWYNAGGQKHRDGDLPAVWRMLDHNTIIEIWYQRGKISREDDKPAVIQYKDRVIWLQTWYVGGREGRGGGRPSSIEYVNGREIHKYFRGDKLDRWVAYSGGRIVEERWSVGLDGRPDRIKYDECPGGVVETQYWTRVGKERLFRPN
jgi:hypothetical protein